MKYIVIHPVEHDNQRTAEGFIELPAEAAEPLLRIGHIAKADKKGSAEKSEGSANKDGHGS